MKKKYISLVFLILLSSCNLPEPASSNVSAGNEPVMILSPQDGEIFSASPVSIQFTATGGPFIEADLLVDNSPISFVAQDAISSSISGTLSWDQPTVGKHTLTIQVLTLNKEIYSASVQVTIEDGSGVGQSSSGDQTPMAQSGPDAGLEAARQRIIQILQSDYGLTVTNPPVGRKARDGVTTDPWTSALYYKDTFISISIYPDGREEHHAYPLNYSDLSDPSNLIKPEDKPIPMCRPSGTIKLLVVFVDYQNLDVTQQEAFDALVQTVAQINGKYVEASQAGGMQNPILNLQATDSFISSQTIMTGHLITPDLVRTSTGYDPAQFDILVQIDLDANDTSGMTADLGSYAYATSGCGDLPVDVNMWIAISKKEQLSQTSNDPRLQYTLGHEILHTMGYPIGLTGVHEWVCGDGSLPDLTDQCDQNNLPTLMMGWTDTDGDGVVELLDTTPYGLQSP
ncbi:MAG: hypothetical protein HY863_14805 [Chloroflexi bacterium]|nr:hypothetical protein [Chloroflexota bacterium]